MFSRSKTCFRSSSSCHKSNGGAKENCPTFVGEVVRKLHIGFDDPDAFTGTEEQIIEEFRRVRDEIRSEMSKL